MSIVWLNSILVGGPAVGVFRGGGVNAGTGQVLPKPGIAIVVGTLTGITQSGHGGVWLMTHGSVGHLTYS